MAIKLTVGHDEELKRKVLKDRMSKEAPPQGKGASGVSTEGVSRKRGKRGWRDRQTQKHRVLYTGNQ